MPTPFQIALALEAAINPPGLIAMIFYPELCLNLFLTDPLPTPTPAIAVLLMRFLGVMVIALTALILFAYPEGPASAGKRKAAYLTLATIEASSLPLWIAEALGMTEESMLGVGGLSRVSCGVAVGVQAAFLGWRMWVFWMRPEWLEGRTEGGSKRD